ncbi:penicillin acylase family protein [Cellulomonas wangsupingiae]|uniref:Penicillin acylase family protein n=1 Tax=Cellulomonas wangsupingiae TaxID=2968085 RepID=A0ABY5K9A6_9CELL|nr:penicillin acylase family protein [Cellulomonas wangsupingiae]MCC2334291.1 penicillin acylase family protein [Cellulomonas wangsupingiae]MCM0641290.1 penicillin acylase family protein [Cellulomonas wangsupingiae]UUI65966.1 penicillin acylase family protein [Cellulomonas wangsupingiae]
MPRRHRMRTALVVTAVVVVVALVTSALATALVLRRPLPDVQGTQRLPGLGAEVQVTRDARGVPTVVAETPHDLFLAQGYVSAQDRFFEMDYRRHVTAGRLSELVGVNEDALASDKVVRTLGWRVVAEQEWALLSDTTRAHLQAYADGVNAYLEDRDPGSIAMEYTVLGLRVPQRAPEPWDPVDSLAWLKAMAWDLRSNYDRELSRAITYQSVPDVARVEELFPPYPQDRNMPILTAAELTAGVQPAVAVDLDLTASDLQDALASADRALAAVPHLVGEGEGVGSNSWVVSGEHTVSGKPILANDPHLGISAPGIWSQVGLRCADVSEACPYDVTGFALAGLPGVVIGHNGALAWGLTNMGADVTDFFLERIDRDGARVDGGHEQLGARMETIEVAGGDDVEIAILSTRHGPIVSDVLPVNPAAQAPVPADAPGTRFAVSLAWTALEPGRTVDALFSLMTADDADDVAAAAALFDVPSQNIVFATTDGRIGYQAPGRIPVRAAVDGPVPSDGTWPRPGWDSRYDWQGWVDPAAMPRTLDPAEGFVVAANQAVTPAGVGPFLGRDVDYGYRSQRIRDLLTARIAEAQPVDVASTADLQTDQRSPYAQVLVPALLEITVEDPFDRRGQQLLRDWDQVMDVDSAAGMYFAAVWADVLELTFADDLPEGHGPTGDSRWLEVVRTMLENPTSPWWDDRSTPGVVEGRDDVLARALVQARRQLTAQIGSRTDDWAWGLLHVAAPQHPVLGGDGSPDIVRRVVNPSPQRVGGGSSIVDASGWDASSGSFAVTSAASMRMVVDLGDLDASTWVNLTGTSGHPASSHYDDQLEAWAQGRQFPWPYSGVAVEADAVDRQTLAPAEG